MVGAIALSLNSCGISPSLKKEDRNFAIKTNGATKDTILKKIEKTVIENTTFRRITLAKKVEEFKLSCTEDETYCQEEDQKVIEFKVKPNRVILSLYYIDTIVVDKTKKESVLIQYLIVQYPIDFEITDSEVRFKYNRSAIIDRIVSSRPVDTTDTLTFSETASDVGTSLTFGLNKNFKENKKVTGDEYNRIFKALKTLKF